MSSKLARTPVVSMSAMFALVALAFSSGCAGDIESLVEDEEVGRTPSITLRPLDPEAMKHSCESKGLIWENATCRRSCKEGYEVVRGTCVSTRLPKFEQPKKPKEPRDPQEPRDPEEPCNSDEHTGPKCEIQPPAEDPEEGKPSEGCL